jgi:hypothetical protein
MYHELQNRWFVINYQHPVHLSFISIRIP